MWVGADGRCKVVDFERLNVLREWHVNGPVTVLSVLTVKEVEDGGSVVAVGRTVVSQTSLQALGRRRVEVVRLDGRQLNLLTDIVANGASGRVLDVE